MPVGAAIRGLGRAFKKFNSRSPNFEDLKQAPEFDRRICAAFPKVPVIDFEIQKIRHCSKKVINGSRRYASVVR